MSFEIKIKPKKGKNPEKNEDLSEILSGEQSGESSQSQKMSQQEISEEKKEKKEKKEKEEVCDTNEINKLYNKKCGNNLKLLEYEEKNREELTKNPNQDQYLYPTLDDPNFNIKIAEKKEFSDTKYDGTIYGIEEYARVLSTAEYELLPQQAFVRNFLSFQTPYNSLLLFHGLGSGKTCSGIGVCEEMRDYLKQMGINKRIIIVASPNVQDNFKLQLFDERKLKLVDGIWTMKGCLGNKLLKEINPTGMTGLKREKIIQQVKDLINASYSFQGYLQFSNEIVRKAGKPNDTTETKIRNLQHEYGDRLILIDEVHNIRVSEDNDNKNVAKNLMYLASVVNNLRLLLLSATPMFNSYKEIIWLLNLMNMNDRRGIISVSDIFDKNGEFKKDENNNEIGKEMLMHKATGYVSYIRGENPYTFPFRVYPDRFAPDNTFRSKEEYPKFQINGKKIPDERKIEKLSLYLTKIGDYQQYGYNYIIDLLRNRDERMIATRHGTFRKKKAFSALKSFGYTDLQIPVEALNIIYPYDGLEDLAKNISPLVFIDEEEQNIDDISPAADIPETDITEEIDTVLTNGPKIVPTMRSEVKSELESEPAVTEGIEADLTMFNNVVEPDVRNIPVLKPKLKKSKTKQKTDTIFDIIEDEEEEVVNTNKGITKMNIPSPTIRSFSETVTPFEENVPSSRSGLHIIEGETKSNMPQTLESIQRNSASSRSLSSQSKGGAPSGSESASAQVFIDPKELTGKLGLKRIMNYLDSKTPSIKGAFEYRRGVPHVFSSDEIGHYSSKIKTICDYIYNTEDDEVSDGIILIYSSYIDSGIIPMALALEEMGFTRAGDKNKSLFKNPPVPAVDVRTMKPPSNKKDFKPARYAMITGDPRISPNNDQEVKNLTNDDNLNGEKIKVVLISQAGSEGLDFKAIRQIHIMDPWYNINRIEQIIGRGVRNFSHKDLPFDQRNVQIFLYGTILENSEEEAADLYIYRISEVKAVKIGKVTRLLKQTAVDCIINHDQTNFTTDNFNRIKENADITQILSDHQVLKEFQVGDLDNSPTCDFMKCEFDCLPNVELDESRMNFDTYNETFMLINSDKIIQKIKNLMKIRYFYKKHDLLQLINIPKKYPIAQIYAALTQIINDNTEYIIDKYGRTGYLINIGDYYLFQPSELNYNNVSIYDRSVPIDYKHDMIKFHIKTNVAKPVIDKRNILDKIISEEEEIPEEMFEGRKVFENMYSNYKLALETSKVPRGNDNWYLYCGVVLRKMMKETDIINADSDQERLEILEEFLIQHIVDTLMMEEKVDLLNYLYAFPDLDKTLEINMQKRFLNKSKKYLFSKFITAKGIIGIVIFNGPSRVENLNIFILDKETNKWIPAEAEDKKDLSPAILKKYKLKLNLNHYVGFIGFENNKKYMVYKIKDTANERSTGFRCDQSGKEKVMNILNDIENGDRYVPKKTKDGAYELCVRQELTLRSFEYENVENKTWFLDTETAIINEFEKKEKPKK